jgi:hypothetical protein
MPVADPLPCGVKDGGAGDQQRIRPQARQRLAAAVRAEHHAGRGPPDQACRGDQRTHGVDAVRENRCETREPVARRRGRWLPAAGQHCEMADVPPSGCEQGDAQPLVDTGRDQAVGPGRKLLGRVGQVRWAQRRTFPVGTGDLDVPRDLRAGEELHGPGVQVDGHQGVVAVAQRVGERQECTVERNNPAEDLEQ